ncbi:glycosyltransferase [Paucidesulfovibrio longus]|uniref:glycosyltransferase n=1 Tax=Paucidesulfovibrio longus TaxID=889 RepID=UPI0003B5074F|nr:glycosyltransferase [Paucidesulfovibrio longus]
MQRPSLFTRDPATLFSALPGPLRERLGIGSCGVRNLLDMAGRGLDAPHNAALGAVYADMLFSALGESPLNGELAGRILNIPELRELIEPDRAALLRSLADAWQRPANLSYFQNLAARRDMAKLRGFLEGRICAEPDNLFWREQALTLAISEGDPDFALAALDSDVLRGLAPVHAAGRWQAFYMAGRHDEGADLAQETEALFGAGFAHARAAESALAGGGRGEGLCRLLASLARSPWRVNELLRASELLDGQDQETAPMRGQVCVLLYTWNKADDLDAALAALARSDLGLARIAALNNGSTDHTARVLAKWQGEFGRDRMSVVELPVNVGAPAARNWLLHAEAKDADWLVYLDDDALVPRDWLGRLGAAVQRLPEAGVWGCRVVDDAQPLLAQSADYHLTPPGAALADAPDLSRIEPHPFKLSNLQIQGLDRGQFNYVRPCASVTGCCHLFRRDRLLEAGDFSLYLSPSQYDDMERDLRMLAKGRLAAYQGHLRVRHRKRTGRSTLVPGQENANALGNRYKMQVLHGAEEIAEATRKDAEAVLADLQARMERVRPALEEQCATDQDS